MIAKMRPAARGAALELAGRYLGLPLRDQMLYTCAMRGCGRRIGCTTLPDRDKTV
jgi:hypothetical protein